MAKKKRPAARARGPRYPTSIEVGEFAPVLSHPELITAGTTADHNASCLAHKSCHSSLQACAAGHSALLPGLP